MRRILAKLNIKRIIKVTASLLGMVAAAVLLASHILFSTWLMQMYAQWLGLVVLLSPLIVAALAAAVCASVYYWRWRHGDHVRLKAQTLQLVRTHQGIRPRMFEQDGRQFWLSSGMLSNGRPDHLVICTITTQQDDQYFIDKSIYVTKRTFTISRWPIKVRKSTEVSKTDMTGMIHASSDDLPVYRRTFRQLRFDYAYGMFADERDMAELLTCLRTLDGFTEVTLSTD